TDKGVGVLTHFETDTWVTYTRDAKAETGKAVIRRGSEVIKTVPLRRSIPHNYILSVEFDGNDAWVATAKGLGHAVGKGYYRGLGQENEQ
ncbi:MAG TPA: hypothetical protein VE890_00460, partial [Thermoguttaceae bacterium]|nr:hypothetical protein [Thermoguttaceae bacterium]